MQFKRTHHQLIAGVLSSLDAALLCQHQCFFGGGTAIALCYGEYRESIDIDFLVSDINAYRQLRRLVTSPADINTLIRVDAQPLVQSNASRIDSYAIRTQLLVNGQPIKFEIINEGRFKLQRPTVRNQVCGVSTLAPVDMAVSKLLANSDRGLDDGTFNRDIMDLAMMSPSKALLTKALGKLPANCRAVAHRDLDRSIQRLKERDGWLERCMKIMAVSLPIAAVWQKLRRLQQVSARCQGQ